MKWLKRLFPSIRLVAWIEDVEHWKCADVEYRGEMCVVFGSGTVWHLVDGAWPENGQFVRCKRLPTWAESYMSDREAVRRLLEAGFVQKPRTAPLPHQPSPPAPE